jgi:pimeloyl-ACP methyl ester carboxylesterase
MVQDVRMPRLVLIHGAATTARVWGDLAAALSGEFDIATPQRRYSGDWDAELDDLAPLCSGAFVVGVSGGATLGLGLAARGVELRGAILHEPAAGSLAPNLLDRVIAALASGGAPAFGAALYGSGWSTDLLPESESAVSRDLAMFRRFEPQSSTAPLAGIVLTVGENSPALRHQSVRAVADVVGARVVEIPGASHAVHLDSVPAFADLIRSEAGASVAPARTLDSVRANVIRKGN